MEFLDDRSIRRAVKTIGCLPFNNRFYLDVKVEGFSAKNVFEKKEEYASDQKSWFRTSRDVEASFRALIRIGVLRREVDGQGLTEKIRLTPLGRQLLEDKPDLSMQKISAFEKMILWFSIKWFWQ